MLEETGFESRLDTERLRRVNRHIAGVRPRYREFSDQAFGVDPETFQHEIPAALMLNMEYQMKGQSTPHLLDDVAEEIQNLRRDAGYPALAIPASEILGTQAMFNVLQGKYSVLTSEFADLMLGYYGTTLGDKDPEVVGKAASRQNKDAITCRPADLLEPSWERRRTEALAVGSNGSDEDVLTYAMFPNAATRFFQTRGAKNTPGLSRDARGVPERAPVNAAGSPTVPAESRTYIVRVSGEEHNVTVTPAQ
jgi:methylmalonyl-CoA carboxyltransferase 5S subunit